MKSFNVIIFDPNSKKFKSYDVIPFLVDCYKERRPKLNPKTHDDWVNFVKSWSMYQWWGRCEYEIILSEWPPHDNSDNDTKEKWDVHGQVMMNIDIISELVKEEVKNELSNTSKRSKH